jgi:hypothetical protein
LLAPVLERAAREVFGRPLTLVDSATAMAQAAAGILGDHAALRSDAGAGGRGSLRCFVTDASRLDDVGPRFLGEVLPEVSAVDLGV